MNYTNLFKLKKILYKFFIFSHLWDQAKYCKGYIVNSETESFNSLTHGGGTIQIGRQAELGPNIMKTFQLNTGVPTSDFYVTF